MKTLLSILLAMWAVVLLIFACLLMCVGYVVGFICEPLRCGFGVGCVAFADLVDWTQAQLKKFS